MPRNNFLTFITKAHEFNKKDGQGLPVHSWQLKMKLLYSLADFISKINYMIIMLNILHTGIVN